MVKKLFIKSKIICPYEILRKVLNERTRFCSLTRCCMICPKKGNCKISSCGVFHATDGCSVYPITRIQAKSLAYLFKLTSSEELDSWNCDEYFQELRGIVKFNKWRKKVQDSLEK